MKRGFKRFILGGEFAVTSRFSYVLQMHDEISMKIYFLNFYLNLKMGGIFIILGIYGLNFFVLSCFACFN